MKTQPLDFERPIAELERKLDDLKRHSRAQDIDFDPEVRRIQAKIEEMRRQVYSRLDAWQRVLIARHPQRPFMLDYITLAFSDFVELHGDRLFSDDKAMPCGLAKIGGIRCAVIGHQKGRDVKENLKRNFGSAHPEGYRKALRVMRLAEKFKLPVVALVDTPGAYPGVGAEERHISEAIAVNLREMMLLKVPIVSVIIGEGGSGGALGIAVADRLLMFENSYYSVISPEGCAAILWKSSAYKADAAEAMKLTARDLYQLNLIDEVIAEPLGGAHQNHEATAAALKEALVRHLRELEAKPEAELVRERYAKFRRIGAFGPSKNGATP